MCVDKDNAAGGWSICMLEQEVGLCRARKDCHINTLLSHSLLQWSSTVYACMCWNAMQGLMLQ